MHHAHYEALQLRLRKGPVLCRAFVEVRGRLEVVEVAAVRPHALEVVGRWDSGVGQRVDRDRQAQEAH